MKNFIRFNTILLLVISTKICAITYFDPDSVRVIDYNNTTKNVIFKGDIPRATDGSFDEKDLKNAMKAAFNDYKTSHPDIDFNFPKKFGWIIISLLTPQKEQEMSFVPTLYDFFSDDPQPTVPVQTEVSNSEGTWVWYPMRAFHVYSPPVDPNSTWPQLNTIFANLTRSDVTTVLVDQTYDGLQLNFVDIPELMDKYINTKEKYPCMIYVHSRHGVNRTGAAQSAYLMKYKSNDVETAYTTSVFVEEDGDKTPFFMNIDFITYLYYYNSYLEQL